MSNARILVVTGVVLVGAMPLAQAADCGVLGFLGACEVTKNIAKEAAEVMAKSLDTASLNARELTNQFGALVADLHGTDQPRKARAKSIFQGVLGPNAEVDKQFSLQYSVRLIAAPTVSMEIDSYLFGRDFNEGLQQLFANDKAVFRSRKLNGTSVVPLSDEETKLRVMAAAKVLEAGEDDRRKKCLPEVASTIRGFSEDQRNQQFAARMAACDQKYRIAALADVVLALRATPSAVPVSNRHTDVAPGGTVALLVRQSDLKALKDAKAKLELWVHEADKPEKPTLRFQDPNTKAVVPQVVDPSEFESDTRCIKSTKPHGNICYLWVPLRLEAITPAEPTPAAAVKK
jgi:hypothetical protein